MSIAAHSSGRTMSVAVRTLIVLTLLLGVGYTAVVTGLGYLAFPDQSHGSMMTDGNGEVRGSSLIGQSFTDADGNPLPQYFQSRPSAAGDAGYDAASSSGTNWGPENENLVEAITQRKTAIAELNGVPESEVPADALTASSSGLDPHISERYADIQIERVARERDLPVEQVRELVTQHTKKPDLGYVGDRVVNVAELNLALDETRH
ncbi:potassium-transporting ATPase subunit KdpC [Kocuria rhizophila]|uniref:potassium-transporting ATPase subunit KdpC n=1 Tax=Kocuria rhizophila TaxID=72000 RepID=UPI0038694EAE|nr:potassium-transporting ATPase subunit KdpC [Kocuria rhizophila]WSZ53409.1 potassium-transporting ATPase subunit KdpC [Kocuria rhizophila]